MPCVSWGCRRVCLFSLHHSVCWVLALLGSPNATREAIFYFDLMRWAPSPERKEGYAIHVYTASAPMDNCCLGNADGDLLIVPQQGASKP